MSLSGEVGRQSWRRGAASRGRGAVAAPGRGRRAGSLPWEGSSGSPSPGRRRAGQVEGALPARPATAPRASPPAVSFSGIQEAEAAPGCGQLSADAVQGREGKGKAAVGQASSLIP